MLRKQLEAVFDKAQNGTGGHPKLLYKISEIYNQTKCVDDFVDEFMRFIINIITKPTTKITVYMQRICDFIAKFIANETQKEENKNMPHILLTQVIGMTLQYCNYVNENIRYYACYIVALILQEIGANVSLENELCDMIQRIMLERIEDPKKLIVLQAISALIRLQNPSSPDCPVIRAYVNALSNASYEVRKLSLKLLAPCRRTLPEIKSHILDVDYRVRAMAFMRCSLIAPCHFGIVDRQDIVYIGFMELNASTKKVFLDTLLPAWVTSYEMDFLRIFRSIRLSPEEEDTKKFTFLCENLMKFFFANYSVGDIINALKLENRLIPHEKLTNESCIYWRLVVKFLDNPESGSDLEDHSEILPELIPFCNYIEKYIVEKSKEKLNEWETLEYYFNLSNLLDIVDRFDLSDECVRSHVRKFTHNLLSTYLFSFEIIKKLVDSASRCYSDMTMFTNELCEIIECLKDPPKLTPLTRDRQLEYDYKLAQMRVNVQRLEIEEESAIRIFDYDHASLLRNEITKITKELDVLSEQCSGGSVQSASSGIPSRNENEIKYRSFDILNAMLMHKRIATLTPSLVSIRINFVMPLVSYALDELSHSKMLKCLALYGGFSKSLAKEVAPILSIPIAAYKSVTDQNVQGIEASISGLCDLVKMYGIKVICEELTSDEEEVEVEAGKDGENVRNDMRNSDAGSSSVMHKTRTLYNDAMMHFDENEENDVLTVATILNIFYEMLNNENETIRISALKGISMIIMETQGSPKILSKLIIKWFNPETAKNDQRVQQLLGHHLTKFSGQKRIRKHIIAAVLPTIVTLDEAKKPNPLADISIENVMIFFKSIVKCDNIDVDFCLDIINFMLQSSSGQRINTILTRFLIRLDLDTIEDEKAKQLLEKAEELKAEMHQSKSKLEVDKLIVKIKSALDKFEQSRCLEQISSEQNPIVQNPIEQNPIEQNSIEQNPIEQTPNEQNPIEQNPIEQIPNEQNPIEQNPVVQNPKNTEIVKDDKQLSSKISENSITRISTRATRSQKSATNKNEVIDRKASSKSKSSAENITPKRNGLAYETRSSKASSIRSEESFTRLRSARIMQSIVKDNGDQVRNRVQRDKRVHSPESEQSRKNKRPYEANLNVTVTVQDVCRRSARKLALRSNPSDISSANSLSFCQIEGESSDSNKSNSRSSQRLLMKNVNSPRSSVKSVENRRKSLRLSKRKSTLDTTFSSPMKKMKKR